MMKYQQKDFIQELKLKIQETEAALKKHSEKLLRENKSIFDHKNLVLDAGLDIIGDNPFKPGYCSKVAIGLSKKTVPNGELVNLHVITIWECQRTLLGLNISNNLPGSKIIGEFVSESIEEIQEELKEYIEEFLSEEY